MAFQFKLDTLLTYRKILEDQALQLLAAEQKKLAEYRLRLHELQAEKLELITAFEICKKEERLSPLLFALYMNQLEHEEGEIQERCRMVERQKKCVEKAQSALAESVKKRKVIERAREKALLSYVQESLRGEQCENDEYAVLRHGRSE